MDKGMISMKLNEDALIDDKLRWSFRCHYVDFVVKM